MDRHLIVCKCGKIKFKDGWKYSTLPISSFFKDMCDVTKNPNVIITLIITQCDKCLVLL